MNLDRSPQSHSLTKIKEPRKLSDYSRLLDLGLCAEVASRMSEMFKIRKLSFSSLDSWAIEALKMLSVNEANVILDKFMEANLDHVTNKSAYLCGIIKAHRMYPEEITPKKPDVDQSIKKILARTGYSLEISIGQRKYGGPPPMWTGSVPGSDCVVFCGKIPFNVFEDKLIPLFEKCGRIWELRLMIDPCSGLNRGFAFVTFTNKEEASRAVQFYDKFEVVSGRQLRVNLSSGNTRLFVGNIPKSKSKGEILAEFNRLTIGLVDVIIYTCFDNNRMKNRGFCFLDYESHHAANVARRRLSNGRTKVWNCDIIVDWADPQKEPDAETMSKVRVLYCRNLPKPVTENVLEETFEKFGDVERVKKIKDFAFIHFANRDSALLALNSNISFGANVEISLAKPPTDKKEKEEVLRRREHRMMMLMAESMNSNRHSY